MVRFGCGDYPGPPPTFASLHQPLTAVAVIHCGHGNLAWRIPRILRVQLWSNARRHSRPTFVAGTNVRGQCIAIGPTGSTKTSSLTGGGDGDILAVWGKLRHERYPRGRLGTSRPKHAVNSWRLTLRVRQQAVFERAPMSGGFALWSFQFAPGRFFRERTAPGSGDGGDVMAKQLALAAGDKSCGCRCCWRRETCLSLKGEVFLAK